MKKYLITGALALVACATLTSCHSDDELSGSLIEQKLQTYEKVFKEEFGEVNPNQDWGFGASNQMAARLLAARTRGEDGLDHSGDGNTNHNLWGDPTADNGSWNWDVPPALTPEQKLRVTRYFQTHPNLTYVAPPIDDYFVQQVYKGGEDPLGSITNSNNYSAEQYPTGNNDIVTGSGHMDWLTVTSKNMHVNDFNYGQYNGGNTVTVLNTGESTNNITDATTHQDEITLMLDARPDCVGYSVSNGSVHHNNCAALVSAKIIDDWANALDEPIGDNVWYDDPSKNLVNQKWNRSFVGLDYEQLAPEQCYVNEVDENHQPIPGTVAYVMVDDIQRDYFRLTVKENGQNVTKILSKAQYKAQYGNYLLDRKGNRIPYISRNSNDICGTNVDFANQEAYMPRTDCTSAGGGNNDQVLDVDLIWGKVEINALPCQNASLQNWIKDIGGRDYYFTDWIVTLTPGKKVGGSTITIPIDEGGQSITYKERTYKELHFRTEFAQCGRIMCEDLGTSSISDIDFNDIVFDAWMYNMIPQTRTKVVKVVNNVETETLQDWSEWADDDDYDNRAYTLTDVYLLAGGGTIPATVNGVAFKSALGSENPILVNTVDDRDKEYPKKYGNPFDNKTGWHQPDELKGLENLNSFNDIDVVVLYQNSPVKLTSEPGEVPHKICVPILPTPTKWPYERIVINEAYDFNDYVKNGSTINYVGTTEPMRNNEGKVVGYYLDEEGNNVWTKPANDEEPKNQTGSRYHGDISDESDITGIPYKDSLRVVEGEDSYTDSESLGYVDGEEITESGTSGGYQQGDPVLIRVRH